MQDVVIIGSGPAGLSAALYMLRGGFSTTVIGKDNGALEKAEKIENYFGLERPLSGHELIENGRTQVQRLGGTLLQDEVVGISWNGNYLISTVSTQIEARTIILTTGTSRKTMKIKNLAQLEGHGVSYCAVCFVCPHPVSAAVPSSTVLKRMHPRRIVLFFIFYLCIQKRIYLVFCRRICTVCLRENCLVNLAPLCFCIILFLIC